LHAINTKSKRDLVHVHLNLNFLLASPYSCCDAQVCRFSELVKYSQLLLSFGRYNCNDVKNLTVQVNNS